MKKRNVVVLKNLGSTQLKSGIKGKYWMYYKSDGDLYLYDSFRDVEWNLFRLKDAKTNVRVKIFIGTKDTSDLTNLRVRIGTYVKDDSTTNVRVIIGIYNYPGKLKVNVTKDTTVKGVLKINLNKDTAIKGTLKINLNKDTAINGILKVNLTKDFVVIPNGMLMINLSKDVVVNIANGIFKVNLTKDKVDVGILKINLSRDNKYGMLKINLNKDSINPGIVKINLTKDTVNKGILKINLTKDSINFGHLKVNLTKNTYVADIIYYYNAAINESYRKNDCGTDYEGSLVTVNIPYGTYSGLTQASADAQARAAAQVYANDNGTCTYVEPYVPYEPPVENVGFITSGIGGGNVGFYVYGTTIADQMSITLYGPTGNQIGIIDGVSSGSTYNFSGLSTGLYSARLMKYHGGIRIGEIMIGGISLTS